MNLEDLLGKLDVRAKVRLLTGATFFTLHDEPSIELAAMAFSDGPTGVRGVEFSTGPRASLLPNATLLASCWSEEVAHEVGDLLAEEAERQHIHVVLGPTINLHRSPLGGRLFEAYSEDPLLTGRLAAAYVRGLQERGVGACLKHLVANEAETERHTVNSRVDERTLRELYLLPFEIAVQDADPWSVMAAYNDVNGVPATEQGDVNNGILKQEWDWDGLLMSDWFATKSAGPAANGGLDLVMPGPSGPWGEALVDAVEGGEVRRARPRRPRRSGCCVSPSRVGALGEPRSWPPEPIEPDERRTTHAAARPGCLRHDRAPQRRHAPARAGRPAGADRAERAGDDLHGRWVGAGPCSAPGQRGRRTCRAAGHRRDRRRRRGGSVATPEAAARPGHRPGHWRRRACGSGSTTRRASSSATTSRPRATRTCTSTTTLAARRRAQLSAIVPAGAQRLGVLGAGDWTFRAGDFTGSAAPRMDTEDLAEAILRPPGWEIDVVLDAAHRGRRRGRPVRLPARAQHARPGGRADPADGRRGHRGGGRRRGGRRGRGGRGRAHRGAGDRGARQDHARPPRPTGRARRLPSRPRLGGPSSW